MTAAKRPFLDQAVVSSGAAILGGVVFVAKSHGNTGYLLIGVAAAVVGTALLTFVLIRWNRTRRLDQNN